MKTKNDEGKVLFKMLACQYKPLEKRFLKDMTEAKQEEVIAKYKNGSYLLKIQILDRFANFLGL